MRKNYIIISIVFVASFLPSCTFMQYVKMNNNATKIWFDYLYKKNGNAFYLDSTYANGSIVWTYDENRIIIYYLVKGTISKKQVFAEKEWIKQTKISIEDIDFELLQKCFYVLDGDGFGFKIKCNEIIYRDSYGTDIECLKTSKFKSDFLNKISKDIRKYKMWE